MAEELEKVGIKQLDYHEPKVLPFHNGEVKELIRDGIRYICTGFQVFEQDDDTILVKETYWKEVDPLKISDFEGIKK